MLKINLNSHCTIMNPHLQNMFSLATYPSCGADQLRIHFIRKQLVVTVGRVGGPDCITVTFKLSKKLPKC